MAFDIQSIALINFAVQWLLVILVLAAVFLAKRVKRGIELEAYGRRYDLMSPWSLYYFQEETRGRFRKHFALMRVAVPVEILAVLGLILPSMSGFLEKERYGLVFTAELLVHHGLGLLVIILWVYINLVSMGVIGTRRGFRMAMRYAFALWLLTFAIGMHLYYSIWV